MNTPSNTESEKESVIIYDLSPQLEAELLRRARENNTDPASEASEILEDHARQSGDIG